MQIEVGLKEDHLSRAFRLPLGEPMDDLMVQLRRDQIFRVYDISLTGIILQANPQVQLNKSDIYLFRPTFKGSEFSQFRAKLVRQSENSLWMQLPFPQPSSRLHLPQWVVDHLRQLHLKEMHEGQSLSRQIIKRPLLRWWHGPFDFEVFFVQSSPFEFWIDMDGICARYSPGGIKVFRSRSLLWQEETWDAVWNEESTIKMQVPFGWWARIEKTLRVQTDPDLQRIHLEFFKRGLV